MSQSRGSSNYAVAHLVEKVINNFNVPFGCREMQGCPGIIVSGSRITTIQDVAPKGVQVIIKGRLAQDASEIAGVHAESTAMLAQDCCNFILHVADCRQKNHNGNFQS